MSKSKRYFSYSSFYKNWVHTLLVTFLLMGLYPAKGYSQGNLLRNHDFQDDWITYLPELKNHHWNYTTEVFNRRDYNPDGWRITGTWEWKNPDKPRDQRRLSLGTPSKASQITNWITIHDPKKLSGWPDAGGYPSASNLRSSKPDKLIRDLVFSAKITGKNIEKESVAFSVFWSNNPPSEHLNPKIQNIGLKVFAPEGTYEEKLIEIKLPSSLWLEKASKDKNAVSSGTELPLSVICEIENLSKNKANIDVIETSLVELGEIKSNLLKNGDFELVNNEYPSGWSKIQRYRYFPPGIYYIFNTWHNSNSDLRGFSAIDSLTPHSGKNSLKQHVPSGDESCVTSEPIELNQKECRAIEVSAWIKTHQACMIQIDAENENGERLDCYNFIQKNPLSIGTSDWRQIRQVFAPKVPLKSMKIKLCARGMNGYTLGGTGHQPQQNVHGIVWWDDVKVFEPESSEKELNERRIQTVRPKLVNIIPHLKELDLGEQLLGSNSISARIFNPGEDEDFSIQMNWLDSPNEKPYVTKPIHVKKSNNEKIHLNYEIKEPGIPYKERPFSISLIGSKGTVISSSNYAYSTWTTPIDLELGSLYLQPQQKLFARVNLGFSHEEMSKIKKIKFDILEKKSLKVLNSISLDADQSSLAKQRTKIPIGLLDDLRNLIVTDLDVSFLPVQPFENPERKWLVKVSAVNVEGKPIWNVLSSPFCRLNHDKPQAPIQSVTINEHGDFLINGKPWMPWGVAYGHNPVYDGPADSGKYYDLANLKPWSLYDRYGGNLKSRDLWDTNCERHVETPKFYTKEQLEALWKQGLYTSTAFLPPKTKPWPEEHLKYLSSAPMVASVSPGPEEAFAYFTPMSQKQLDDLKIDVDYLRKATGKPVMVGHGGYWNRLEFERAKFFDVYDPETEPWYPAPIHTDLKPLIENQKKAIWLRPQMYESVPYERWRYHVYVELIRGARGWQLAHGPSDPSVFRGLQAELRHLQPLIYSHEKPSSVKISPPLENMVKKSGNKNLIIAATTHGLTFGNYRESSDVSPDGKSRVSHDPHIFRDESDGYHAPGMEPASISIAPHGIQYISNPQKHDEESKLSTWVKLDSKNPPKNIVVFIKADGRWTHAGCYGDFNFEPYRNVNEKAYWFLRTFYRHARGFLGWGNKVEPYALEFMPSSVINLGKLPSSGTWVKLDIPIKKLNASGKLIDGVAFAHEEGRVWWSKSCLTTRDGLETILFGDFEDRHKPSDLKKVKFTVAGLKKGTPIKVLFEDRIIASEDGYFEDDFSGTDLYQRYGGERLGYGNAPVGFHLYEFIQ